jgi:hypothetical protein
VSLSIRFPPRGGSLSLSLSLLSSRPCFILYEGFQATFFDSQTIIGLICSVLQSDSLFPPLSSLSLPACSFLLDVSKRNAAKIESCVTWHFH